MNVEHEIRIECIRAAITIVRDYDRAQELANKMERWVRNAEPIKKTGPVKASDK